MASERIYYGRSFKTITHHVLLLWQWEIMFLANQTRFHLTTIKIACTTTATTRDDIMFLVSSERFISCSHNFNILIDRQYIHLYLETTLESPHTHIVLSIILPWITLPFYRASLLPLLHQLQHSHQSASIGTTSLPQIVIVPQPSIPSYSNHPPKTTARSTETAKNRSLNASVGNATRPITLSRIDTHSRGLNWVTRTCMRVSISMRMHRLVGVWSRGLCYRVFAVMINGYLWEFGGGGLVLMRAVCTSEEQLLGEKNIVSLFAKCMERYLFGKCR